MIVQMTLDTNDPNDVGFLLRAIKGIVPVEAGAPQAAPPAEEKPKKASKQKASKPKASKPKAEKPKAEKPKAEKEQQTVPAEEIEDPKAEVPGPAPELSEEEVRTRFSVFITENGTDVAMGILKDFEVDRMSELKPEQYGEFVGALDKVNG